MLVEYYSNDYVRRKIFVRLMKIKEQDELIKQEIKSGVIPDPSAMNIDPATGNQWVDLHLVMEQLVF